MPPQDPTPLGDAMTHRFPERKIPEPKPEASEQQRIDREMSDADITQPAEAHAPEDIPPMNNPDPQPGDPKPKAPPAQDDEQGRRYIPIELPGQPHAPERVD